METLDVNKFRRIIIIIFYKKHIYLRNSSIGINEYLSPPMWLHLDKSCDWKSQNGGERGESVFPPGSDGFVLSNTRDGNDGSFANPSRDIPISHRIKFATWTETSGDSGDSHFPGNAPSFGVFVARQEPTCFHRRSTTLKTQLSTDKKYYVSFVNNNCIYCLKLFAVEDEESSSGRDVTWRENDPLRIPGTAPERFVFNVARPRLRHRLTVLTEVKVLAPSASIVLPCRVFGSSGGHVRQRDPF